MSYATWVEGSVQDLRRLRGTAPQYRIKPYRCAACGAIELYAEEPQGWRD